MLEKEALNGREAMAVLENDHDSVQDPVLGRLTITELELMPHDGEIIDFEAFEVGGETRISEDVVAGIASVAAKEIPGVADVGLRSFGGVLSERLGGSERTARGVNAEVGTKETILDVTLKVNYGFSIPKTAVAVRQNIANKVLEYCGLRAKEINLHVARLDFPDRMPGRVE